MNEQCDRHPSARAKAKVILPNLGTLYFCMHCTNTLNFGPEYYLEYDAVTV